MSIPESPSTREGRGLSLPGQATEEAVAEVGSEAGRSLLRGLEKLGNAYLGKWIATKEAQAEAARLAVQTASKIETEVALTKARQEREVAELEHQATLQRRLERLRRELAREQLNLEAIERRALEFTEHDPRNTNSREIDEDWLFMFAELAQRISHEDVRDLWARALSSAAIEGPTKLSAAALQTLGLFDKHIAESFKRFTSVAARIGFFPHTDQGQVEPQRVDLPTLVDLGLIQAVTTPEPYDFGDFAFERSRTSNMGLSLLQSHLVFTKRGYDIANAAFRDTEELPLPEEQEQKYFQNILHRMPQPRIAIVAKLEDGSQAAIRLTNRYSVTDSRVETDWTSSPVVPLLSKRLSALLVWAAQTHYDIEIK